MKILVLSDLHCEFRPFAPAQGSADVVVLAGDTNIGPLGVVWAKQNLTQVPVLYLAGNHEYYHHTLPGLLPELREEARGSNIIVMEQNSAEIGGVRFLGCTLWTDLALFSDSRKGAAAAAMSINDFQLIQVEPQKRKLEPLDVIKMHEESLRWLAEELSVGDPARTVVLTHHAPSARSLPAGGDEADWSASYASNLESFVQEFAPALWIHGHTHQSSDYLLGKTRVVCNPRGYPGQEDHGFDPGKIVEI